MVRSWAIKDQFSPSKACRWSQGCEHTTPPPQISFQPVADPDGAQTAAQSVSRTTVYDVVIQSALPDAMLLFTLDGSDVVGPFLPVSLENPKHGFRTYSPATAEHTVNYYS